MISRNPPDRIVESCLDADNLDAAEQFYSQLLGLTLVSKVENRHLFYRCGSSMLLIFNAQETLKSHPRVPSHGAHGNGHLAFGVSREVLSEWRKRLPALGIPIESEVTWPGGSQSLYFRDPAGNSLELVEPALWGLPD